MAEDSCSPPHHFLSSSLLENKPLYIFFFHPHGCRETYIQLHDLEETISMGSKRVGLFIVLFVQLLVDHAASYPQKPLPKTDYFPQNDRKNETGMKQDRQIDHRFGNGSANAGKGGNHGGGGGRGRYLQGKASFIPIYAAGAARRRHRHRSSAGCLRSSAGLSSVVGAATLASLLQFYVVF